MLKSRKGAYDGRGNTVLKEVSPSAISNALSDLGIKESDLGNDALYAEGWINFNSLLALIPHDISNQFV